MSIRDLHGPPARRAPGCLAIARRGLWLLWILFAATASWARDATTFRTNYYQVTGATMREIRESIARSRPWKQAEPLDGRTEWNIRWKYEMDDLGHAARVRAFHVETTITVTMPSWKAPTNAPQPTLEGWKRYFSSLKRHEDVHVMIALQAAAAVRQRAGAIKEASSTSELRRLINQAANQAVEVFRAKDKEYDRVTQHGMRQDAWRP